MGGGKKKQQTKRHHKKKKHQKRKRRTEAPLSEIPRYRLHPLSVIKLGNQTIGSISTLQKNRTKNQKQSRVVVTLADM